MSAASLANPEEAVDQAKHGVHFATARHFYTLTEEEMDRFEAKRSCLISFGAARAFGEVHES
jgi:hypothetical protein